MGLFGRKKVSNSSERHDVTSDPYLKAKIIGLMLTVAILWQPSAFSDALNDAIRQAEQAKEEAQRLARDSEESRQKARQFYNETKLEKFQLAGDEFSAASSDFNRAATSFNQARYYLELMQKYKNPEHASTIEKHFREAGRHYEEAARRSGRGSEWFNGGIEDYNRKLRDERKSQAAEHSKDAFDLMKSTEKKLQAIQGQKGSAVAATCLEQARSRASWAFNNFNSAAANVSREDTYREKVQAGIRDYNEALQTLKKLSETGHCKQ